MTSGVLLRARWELVPGDDMTTTDAELTQEVIDVDALIELAADEWTDGDTYPTLGDWITHFVSEHLKLSDVRLLAKHFLTREVSALYPETPDDLTERIDAVEARLGDAETRLDALDARVVAIERGLARIEGMLMRVELSLDDIKTRL